MGFIIKGFIFLWLGLISMLICCICLIVVRILLTLRAVIITFLRVIRGVKGEGGHFVARVSLRFHAIQVLTSLFLISICLCSFPN